MTKLSITIGKAKNNPRGRSRPFDTDVSPTVGLKLLLESTSASAEAWWSQHTWADNHRNGEKWKAACSVCVDVDYYDTSGKFVDENGKPKHVPPPPEVLQAFLERVAADPLPGSLWHATPRGYRVIFVFPSQCTDPDLWDGAMRGASILCADWIARAGLAGYEVDEATTKDKARLFYTPRSLVDGVQRAAEVQIIRDHAFEPAELVPPPPAAPRAPAAQTFKEASERFNAEHPGEWPRNTGDCPGCGHKGCFGQLPSDRSRWACFSASHTAPGIKGPGCYHGDPLDMAAHVARCSPSELLRRGGYLSLVSLAPAPPPASQGAGAPIPIERAKLQGLTKSYASLCAILREHRKIIPIPLAWNEMLCSPTEGGKEVVDTDNGRLRESIELNVHDSKGKPLLFKSGDITQAVIQVASENKYHPVRAYLDSLEWDGVRRIGSVLDELLGLQRSELNLALITRWFIGAVARIYEPGCELQMVLVFTGAEYAGKSRFFKTLVGREWFSDRKINIDDKDALMLLQKVWFLEWGELAAIKGRDWDTVKNFITSTVNDFRPPYGRSMISAPRHCVIVGTANDHEFLFGREGERRFWPMAIPAGWSIPLDKVAEWRDQLWAEACALYKTGEQWHLTDNERELLREAHKSHRAADPWEDIVREFIAEWKGDLTTPILLEKAIKKPVFNLTRGDDMRMAEVMKHIDYKRSRHRIGGRAGTRQWVKKDLIESNRSEVSD